MLQFKYKYVTKAGETKEGTRESESKYTLAKELAEQGNTLISAKSASDGAEVSAFTKINNIFGRIKLAEKIAFAKNLSAMIDAGLPISRGISVMKRQTKSEKFKDILTTLNASIEKGVSLHESMAEHEEVFSPLFISMVKAGEESGKLSESLTVIAQQMERSYQLQRRIRGAMMYPAIIVGAMIIIGILMLMFVVPTLTDTFSELNVELPVSTRAIIAVSDAFSNSPVITLSTILLVVLGGISGLRTTKGKRAFEFTILRIPIIKELVKETNSARTARTLSSLLRSGVEVVSAINITGDVVQNSYYKDVLREAEEKIQKGESISSVLENYPKLYPPMMQEMVAVGEETGKLSDLFLQIAVFFEGEVEQKTKDMSTIIEPFLMILIGSVVGFFAVSMITPIYSLSSGI